MTQRQTRHGHRAGSPVTVPEGTTLLKAAEKAGRHVPTICYHDHCTANGLCRVCVVEVEGVRPLLPACLSRAGEGMKVSTAGTRVERSRRTILELLASAVDLSEAPEINRLVDDCRAAYERMRAGGVEFTQEPVERYGAVDASFRDPSGNSLEFAEPKIWGL